MVKILKVPDEKFRDKIAQGLRNRLGTINGFLEQIPDRQKIKELLIENFEKVLDVQFHKVNELSKREQEINNELIELYKSEKWLNIPLHRRSELMDKRKVKISSTTQIYQAVYKASGGLIRLFLEIENEKIKDIIISGDFSANPMNAPEIIENALIGQPMKMDSLLEKLNIIFKEEQLDLPGVLPEDIMKTIELSIKDLF